MKERSNVRNVRANILNDLPPERLQMLKGWLTEDKLTYDRVRERLKTEFGVSVCTSTISDFWKNHCAPARAAQNAVLDALNSPAGKKLIVQIVKAHRNEIGY